MTFEEFNKLVNGGQEKEMKKEEGIMYFKEIENITFFGTLRQALTHIGDDELKMFSRYKLCIMFGMNDMRKLLENAPSKEDFIILVHTCALVYWKELIEKHTPHMSEVEANNIVQMLEIVTDLDTDNEYIFLKLALSKLIEKFTPIEEA